MDPGRRDPTTSRRNEASESRTGPGEAEQDLRGSHRCGFIGGFTGVMPEMKNGRWVRRLIPFFLFPGSSFEARGGLVD